MSFETFILWCGVVAFGFFGVLFTVKFNGVLEWLGITAGNTGRVDLIATYVGFELAFSAFLAYCALEPERLHLGLIASGLAFVGFGGGRAAGLLLYHKGAKPLLYGVLAIEVVGAALSFWCASRVR
jgi:hypothetical protein